MEAKVLDFTVKEVVPERPFEVVDWGVQMVNAPKIWAETRGEGVKVAVLDTGVDTSHPDLMANIKAGMNFTGGNEADYFDRQGHGSHCAGIIAGVDNEQGVVGVAPKAELYIAKVLGDNGSGSIQGICEGVMWAVMNKVDIISMSLGCTEDPGPMLQQAIKYAYDNGVVVVAAAGNEASHVGWPAVYEETIAVGAIDDRRSIAGFSNFGTQVDVAAPGVDILSTYPVGKYARLSGTSMATPVVAGTIALMIAHFRKQGITHTPASIMELLRTRSQDGGAIGRDNFFGDGIVDVDKLIHA
jgi:subtilisin